MARPEKIRLGEILTAQKLVSQEQIKYALESQKRSGRKLGRILFENGFVTEDQIAEALAKQLGIPFVNLKFYNVNAAVVRRLPESHARRYRALVLEDRERAYLIGMADPTDLLAYDEISRLLKRDVELAVVTEGLLLEIIDRIYRRTEEISGIARELEQELGDTYIDFGALGAALGAEEAPVVRLLQSMFEDATQVNASDIHIEPHETGLLIRFRIDGILHIQTETDMKIAPALVLRLKLMSGLDISEKRLPQDGRFNVKVRNVPVDVRISTMPTQYGESVAMRLLNQTSRLLELDKLGMPREMLARFQAIIQRSNGMVLVTGPTGCGKTTTLYAALAKLNTPHKKIITVEDPVEYRLPGINQTQVNEKIDLSFSRVLRSGLRQDPDIILVGEMRDEETVQIGLRAAITGHLVFSTLHTRDAVSTPIRLIDMGAPRYMVATSLQAVLAQRLVRLICESCSEPYQPDAHERAWLSHELEGGQDASRFSHGRGCTRCNGTGYHGRTAVYEMLEMTPPLVEAANRENPAHFISAAQQQMLGKTLRHHALDLVLQGRTSVSEAMHITSRQED
ncbi:MAG: GspE/PulE family protein [Burkholderiales bacterium]